MTLASHPGATRHHPRRRRQRPPPLHHRHRRSCLEGTGSGRRQRARGRPDLGTGDRRQRRWWRRRRRRRRGCSVPSLIHHEQQVGAASPAGRTTGSPPPSSPGGSSAEALETGGKGLSSARRLRTSSAILREERAVGVKEEGWRGAEGRGGVRGAGKGGRGRSWKLAELPSGSVSQSRGLRDPPGSPGPG